MKKLVATLLCAVMIATSLTGCGNAGGTDTGDSAAPDIAATEEGEGQEEEGNTETSVAENDLAAQAIAERKESGEYPTVSFVYMNYVGAPAGLERIQNALSEYTQEQLGIKVELELIDSGSYSQQLNLMLSSGEKMDIFCGYSLKYADCVNKGYVLDLEEDNLLETYGQGIIDVMGWDRINSCRFDGKLYALPQQRDYAQGKFLVCIGKEYLDGIGYDYESLYEKEGDEIIYTDLNVINDIFAQLHEAYPDKYVYAPRSANQAHGLAYDSPGGDNIGVLIDFDSTTLVNLYETEEYKEFCKIFYAWNQAGYISQDALSDDTDASAQIKAGSAMSYMMAGKPGIKTQVSNSCGREMIVMQIGEDTVTSAVGPGIPLMINAGAEDPAACMQLYNLLYTDPYASNLLCWGEEGVDYKLTEDGHATYADGVTAETSEWSNNVNWELPNQFIAHIWEGNDLDIWERMEEFNNNAKRYSKVEGFTFNNAEVVAEATAIKNVEDEYGKRLYYGFLEPESGLAEMNQKLKEAGVDTYIAAKQAALDEWLAANGN